MKQSSKMTLSKQVKSIKENLIHQRRPNNNNQRVIKSFQSINSWIILTQKREIKIKVQIRIVNK